MHTATHCNALQHTASHTAAHCTALQHTATHNSHNTHFVASSTSTPAHTATHCNTLQHTATHCTALHHAAPHCTALQHTTHTSWQAHHRLLNTLQHTATHCNTLQQTATHHNTHHTPRGKHNIDSCLYTSSLECPTTCPPQPTLLPTGTTAATNAARGKGVTYIAGGQGGIPLHARFVKMTHTLQHAAGSFGGVRLPQQHRVNISHSQLYTDCES